MKFILDITMGNDAMQSGDDVRNALEDVGHKLNLDQEAGIIRDINGNTVGEWRFEE